MIANSKNVFCKFLFIISSLPLLLVSCEAFCNTVVPPFPSLFLPAGSLAAFGGGDAASQGDISAMDTNPALLSALHKQYAVFGEASWQKYADLVGLGLFDNSTTSFATVLRVRESIPNASALRDRRFTLASSYQVPKTHFSLGAGLNYEQLSLSNLTTYTYDAYYGTLGALYEYVSPGGHPIFFGVGLDKLFDMYGPVVYNAGISTTFGKGFYAFGLESVSSNLSGLQKLLGNVTVNASEFLELKTSCGYAFKDRLVVWGAGVFFHAPILELFYTISNSDPNTPGYRQSVGTSLNFTY